ncbi:hypothetical protein HOH45_05075 [bacterium]|jgi:hypothetical protein|nr:hypothetical protein [bacterium]
MKENEVDFVLKMPFSLIVETKESKNWLASLRVLRTERVSEIRCFQEMFAQSDVNELMLKVA